MKLEATQAKILNSIRLNADVELSDVARKLKVTEKTVRYTLEAFYRRGLIRKSHFFDIYPIGLRSINMYFSVASRQKGFIDQVVNIFLALPEVTFFAELGGEFHYAAAFALKRFEDVRQVLARLPEGVQAALVEKRFTSHVSLKMYPLEFVGQVAIEPLQLSYGNDSRKVEVDGVDKAIVDILVSSPETSLRDTARTLGMSVSSISSRVTALRQEGILRGSWLQINFESLGLSAIKLLVFSQSGEKISVAMDRFCGAHKHVDYLIACVGEWDFEVGLLVQSPEQVMRITQQLYEELGEGISLIRAVPFFRMLKLRQVPCSLTPLS